MKEIDFLPEWYKSGRQRQIGYRAQVIGLGGILLIMIVWNFIATHSISKARAQVEQTKVLKAEAENISREFAGIKSEVTGLRNKVKSMEQIASKIDVASVLAEISFLIDDNIVLSKVKFDAEKFVGEKQATASRGPANVARAAGRNSLGKGALLLGDTRFRVVISGVATGAGDIAKLIRKLEESPYFCQVRPSFSRNREMKVENEKNFQVSEFEISCFLANYREQ
ncbi:MAG: PilN domain-containing protein [Planctomycetes bacterium]|nr:PilN domain-containing protein [Planctomycetota bacterium]